MTLPWDAAVCDSGGPFYTIMVYNLRHTHTLITQQQRVPPHHLEPSRPFSTFLCTLHALLGVLVHYYPLRMGSAKNPTTPLEHNSTSVGVVGSITQITVKNSDDFGPKICDI